MDENSIDYIRRAIEESGARTYIYVRYEPGSGWIRDAQFQDVSSQQLADDLFWHGKDPGAVLLSGVLAGRIQTVDDYSNSAEGPGIPWDLWQSELDALEGSDEPRSWFSVLGVWNTEDPTEVSAFRRDLRHYQAVNALHAELLARADCQNGIYLVAGVVEERVEVLDLPQLYTHANQSGVPDQKEEPPAPTLPVTNDARGLNKAIVIGSVAAVVILLVFLLLH